MRNEDLNPYDPPRRVSVGRIIFYIFAGLVIAALILILVQVLLTRSSGEPPRLFGNGIFQMEDGSMEGAIHEGEALWVRELSAGEYQNGDVIAFRAEQDTSGYPVIRVSRINDIQYINGEPVFSTQADSRSEPDGTLLTVADVYGRVERILPLIGGFLDFIQTPFGLVTCIAVPLGILLVIEIINLIILSRRSRYDEEEEDGEEPEDGRGEPAYASAGARPILPYKAEPVRPETEAENLPYDYRQPSRTREWRPMGRPARPIPTPEEDSLIDTLHFTVTPESVPLEKQQPKQPLQVPFSRRPVSPAAKPDKSSTKEFQVPETVKKAVPPVINPELPPLEPSATPRAATPASSPPPPELAFPQPPAAPRPASSESAAPASVPPPHAVPKSTAPPPVLSKAPVTVVAPGTDVGADFVANMASHGRDRFQIDGIDVRVRPDAIKLALPEDTSERDISITVTNEYTNVTIGARGEEVHFALFRDENDQGQKVIIQKKSK